jgi:CBS domain-containing protein
MTVKAIVSRKGSDVVTIEPTVDLAAAVKLMSERHIGAVVIIDGDRRVAGILSERDIVRALARRGPAVLGETVEAVMTRKVVTCALGDTVGAIMGHMTSGKFRHLPVVEEGRLAAIISIGDVVKHRLEEVERESDALREYIATA